MAIAVLDIDIGTLPASIDDLPEANIEGHEAALVLLRVGGRPAGQALIRLPRGAGESLRNLLLEAADSGFWEAWLRARLQMNGRADQPTELPSTTVVVCTRDRTDDLERCLGAILAMPDQGQEILVVDNAPATEATRHLVSRMPRVRYVSEPRPGLDIARNRALREASGEIVAFTDDDAAPDSLWLQTLSSNFSDPLVMAATGSTMPLELESDAQVDFQRHGGFLRGFKRITYDAAENDPLLAWHAGAGVNMALRRSVTELVGPFDEAMDAGAPTLAGGDSDMFRRILSAGYRIAYDPEALNWHRHRRSQVELVRQLYGYEVAASAVLTKALVADRDLSSLGQIARHFWWELGVLARAAGRRPGTIPVSVATARLRGGIAGVGAYLSARRR